MEENNYHKINYGFSLLRMLMAFEVLLGHFADWNEYNTILVWPFRELVSLAVPCFAILSFYLMAKSFLSRDTEKFKTRLKKLLIPQIGWTIIYYLIYQTLDLTLHTGLTKGFSDFLWQLFTGHSMQLNPTMWYQIDIIVITIIVFLMFYYFSDNKKAYLCFFGLAIVCYILQYSGINRALFGDMRYELKYPLGRVAEMIPFAFIGFSFKYFDLLEKLKKHRYITMIVCMAVFIVSYNIPWAILKDFGYAGVCKQLLAVCIVIFAFLTPLEYLPSGIKKAILVITDYSLGIYCIHRLINTLLYVFVPTISLLSFERCVLLYLVCYVACFIIGLIPNDKTRKLVK